MLLLQLQIFLVIAVLLIAKPAGNALFLARFGSDYLPYMYILTAGVAAVISTLYSLALRRSSLLRLNLTSLGICLSLLLVFAALIRQPEYRDAVAVGLYLWVALFGVLAASQFWMLASLAFDVRQAKRLFGPIGAGAIAGGIAGGYLAQIIAGAYGMRTLLLVASACLPVVMGISWYLWREHIVTRDGRLARRKKTAELRESPHQIILGSRHLLLLCGIIATSVITAKLVDYQFSALAAERYADEDRLTAFFGFWFSTFNVVGLVIQLLVTQRVVQWFGVSGALLVLPAGLGLGVIAMFVVPGLSSAIFSRAVDGSLKQSLHRAGVEMLFLPVSAAVKGRIKTYIDVLIDSAAGGLGGLLLLLLVDGLGVSVPGISLPVAVFVLGWLACVLLVRDEYLDAFRNQLRHLRPKREAARRPLQSRHKEVLSGFLRVLKEAKTGLNDKQLLYVLERTDELDDDTFRQPIVELLDHGTPAVRARALRSLALRDGPDILLQVIPLLVDEDTRVRSAALEYCISHHRAATEELIREQLKDPNPETAGTALVQLLAETRTNPDLRKSLGLEELFYRRLREVELDYLGAELGPSWERKLLHAAGRSGGELGKDYLRRMLDADDPEIVREAIVAAGESLDERFLLRLLDFLSEADYRTHAKAALVQYGLGLVNLLPNYLRRGQIELADVRRLPAVLERVPGQQTVDLLFDLAEDHYPQDLELRLEVLRSLNALRRDYPDLQLPARRITRMVVTEARRYQTNIALLAVQKHPRPRQTEKTRDARQGLINLLRKRRGANLERLLRLLGLRYPPGDIIPIQRGLRADTHRERVSALEFLDVLLDTNLKRIVVPAIETGVRLDENFPVPPLDDVAAAEYGHFRRVLRGRDTRLKLAVLYLVGTLGEDRYMPLLRVQLEAPDARVRTAAGRAFDAILNRVVV